MTTSELPESFLRTWEDTLKSHAPEQEFDFPNYHLPNGADLVTSSTPLSIRTGSGLAIYQDALLPAIASAQHEVILVTCFWAKSDTLLALKETLETLAADRKRRLFPSYQDDGTQPDEDEDLPPLRIRICFSSRSLFQKLFHTRSKKGHTYPPSAWPTLGLPSERLLREARIDMSVKSLFFLPFSVMHPKFVVVDRRRALMPSCNVSWETWFETCIEFTGPVVEALLEFYHRVWEHDSTAGRVPHFTDLEDGPEDDAPIPAGNTLQFHGNPSRTLYRFPQPTPLPPSAPTQPSYPTILLPSAHHRNPHFRLPFSKPARPPTTPLNAALQVLFSNATRSIEIITPNLTCHAVTTHILSALARGVDVSITTSRNMMMIEQLVTSFTTTSITVRKLIQQYEKLCAATADPEQGRAPLGRLTVKYYKPHPGAASQTRRRDSDEEDNLLDGRGDEPVVSHVKMVKVDDEFVVLGSGNMDRASWFTSQELGIMFYIPGLGLDPWSKPLSTRTEVVFPKSV